MVNLPRRPRVLVTAALLAVAVAVVGARLSGCGSTGSVPRSLPTAARSSARNPRDRTEKKASPSVDLSALLAEVPEYQGRGRNLFGFGREKPEGQAAAPATTTSVPPALDSEEAVRQAVPARIDLKLAGFVEKPVPGGESKKYAVFLNGDEVLTGAEGDLVANRYKIVEIGLESVTVALQGSNVTQKIPLRSN